MSKLYGSHVETASESISDFQQYKTEISKWGIFEEIPVQRKKMYLDRATIEVIHYCGQICSLAWGSFNNDVVYN